MDPPASTATFLSLPAEIWEIVMHYALSPRNLSTNERNSERRTVAVAFARLAWTCRAAYMDICPYLWSTLRLVFRSEKPKYRDAGPLMLARHDKVLGESVFPSFDTKRARRAKDLARHAAKVSTYPLLAPYVVLDGKLFLASFARGKVPPDFSGIRSLWGRDVDTRRVGQLDLVEYPMHLVNKVVLDIIDYGVRIDPESVRDKLPFLFCPGRDQVTTFTLLATNPGATVHALHQAMCQHHLQLVHFDYAFKGGHRARPLVYPERARSLHMYSDEGFDAGDTLRNVRSMVDVELRGAGGFSVRGWAKAAVDQVFTLATLKHLVLDYDFPISTINLDHLPTAYSFPSLVSLSITFPLADTLFSRIRAPSPTHAFPRLLDLTLLNTRLVTGYAPDPDTDPDSQVQWLPRVPFVHMPRLASLTLPANHRASLNTARVHIDSLQHFVATCTNLAHLAVPGLRGISVARTNVPRERTPVRNVRSAHVRASHADVFGRWFVFPRLEHLHVIADADVRQVSALLKSAPRVVEVVLQLPVAGVAKSHVWDVLAECAPQVRRVVVMGGGTSVEVVSGGADLAAPVVAVEELLDEALVVAEEEFWSDDDQDDLPAPVAAAAKPPPKKKMPAPPAFRPFSIESLVLLHPTSPPPGLASALPHLHTLTVQCDHLAAFSPVLPHIDQLAIHGRPRSPHAWELVLNRVPATCRVQVFPGPPPAPINGAQGTLKRARRAHVTLRYAGRAHASTWRAVARWGAIDADTVGKVCVQVTGAVEEGEAALVGRVVGGMMGAHSGSVGLRVVWRGEGRGGVYTARVGTAIVEMGGEVEWV